MGLRRRDFGEFYAPTDANTAIRREKDAILGNGPSIYTATSDDGRSVFREFSEMLGHAMNDGSFDTSAATRALSLRVEPDFLLLTPPDWTLAWASVCFPSRWSLDGKLGQPLHEIHSRVPGLNVELGTKIATFFARLSSGEGWARANWGLSASADRNQHPRLPIPMLTAETTADETFVRVEDQHLIKLPRTGAMAFGIRVLSFRLSDIVNDRQVLAGLQEKLQTMPPETAHYQRLVRLLT